jgi:hypothetical protein
MATKISPPLEEVKNTPSAEKVMASAFCDSKEGIYLICHFTDTAMNHQHSL